MQSKEALIFWPALINIFPLLVSFFFSPVRNAIHYFVKISLLAQCSSIFACALLCYYFYYPPQISNFIMGSINNGRIRGFFVLGKEYRECVGFY